MATVRHGDGDPEDPARRRELRQLWRAARKSRRRAVMPWQIWATDPDGCALIIDDQPVPIGWTKIFTDQSTIEQYFCPRQAVVVSNGDLHQNMISAWICPMEGLHGKETKRYPDEVTIRKESIARPSRVRPAHVEWDRAEMLEYKRTVDPADCVVVSDAMRKLVNGYWRDNAVAKRGKVVRHVTRGFDAVVVTSCFQPKKDMTLLLVCPRVDDRRILAEGITTREEADRNWLYMDENGRAFDLTALQPMLARHAKELDSVDNGTIREIHSRILGGFARPPQ
jgi:hypothetical protein